MNQVDTEIARSYNRLSFWCQHYTGEAAVAQKVLALAGRPTTQARDVFDLDILQRGGFAQGDRLRHSVGAQKCSLALRNLDGLSFDDFSGQVLEFLDEEYRREFASPAVWHRMVSQLRYLLSPP